VRYSLLPEGFPRLCAGLGAADTDVGQLPIAKVRQLPALPRAPIPTAGQGQDASACLRYVRVVRVNVLIVCSLFAAGRVRLRPVVFR
jgi:hypothetical protein